MRTWIRLLGATAMLAISPPNAAASLKHPAALSVTAVSPTAVVLSWRDTNAGRVGYVVERRGGSERSRFARVAFISSNVSTAADSPLEPGTTYHYRVRVVRADGRLGPTSRVVSVMTPADTGEPDPPAPPDGVTATATGCQQVDIHWQLAAGIAGYRVYRDDGLVTSVDGATATLSDTSVAASTVYSFAVMALDGVGIQSAPSAPVPVTTPACPPPPTTTTSTLPALPPTTTSSTLPPPPPTTSTSTTTSTTATRPPTTSSTTSSTSTRPPSTTTTSTLPPTGGTPWAWRAGSAGTEAGQAVASGADGNVVVTGYAESAADFGGGVLPAIGALDLVVAKYTAAGAPVWSRRQGGTDTVIGQAVAVGPSGDVVVAGSFTGTADLGTGSLVSAGARDGFVAAYAATGAPLWSRRFGAANDDLAYGVAVDGSGNVLLTGTFRGTVDFGGGALISTLGGYDSMVVKLAGSDGHHLWSRRFTNSGADIAYALALDAAGNPVVTGSFNGRLDFGCGQHVTVGGHDAFVAKLTGAAGACLWSRRFGGTDTDRGQAVAIDGAGDVVVTGFFTFTADFGTGPLTSTGGNDAFVVKLAGASGASVWARRFGGAGITYGLGVASAADGAVVVTGTYSGAVDFGTGVLASAGLEDVFVAELDAAGTPLSSGRFGGADTDGGFAVALGAGGDALLTGFFQQTAAVSGGLLRSAGAQDLFVLALPR